MANPIISPKKSTIAGRVPTTNDLSPGEICINHADAKLYARHPSSGAIQEIGSLSAHSHDQLISIDSTADLELQNNGSVIITDEAIPTTLALSSTAARTITFPDKTGTVAFLDDVGGGSDVYLVKNDFSAPYSYIGRAPVDTDITDSDWDISRIEVASNGTTTTTNAAGAWSNRASLSYT